MSKQRLAKIMAKNSNGDIDESDQTSPNHHEYITAVDESTDDDGSITYIDDYEINDNGDEDGAYFVEYVTEDDNLIAGESNDPEFEENQLTEYADTDDTTEELYNCNLCGMNFKSITDHIEKYHSGQDVLIDISEESGTAIKSERALELSDYQDNDDEGSSMITSDNVSTNDGELIVYGEESLENETELMEEMTDDDNQVNEIYTYDDTTGSLTRATSSRSARTAPNKLNVRVATFNHSTWVIFVILPHSNHSF